MKITIKFLIVYCLMHGVAFPQSVEGKAEMLQHAFTNHATAVELTIMLNNDEECDKKKYASIDSFEFITILSEATKKKPPEPSELSKVNKMIFDMIEGMKKNKTSDGQTVFTTGYETLKKAGEIGRIKGRPLCDKMYQSLMNINMRGLDLLRKSKDY